MKIIIMLTKRNGISTLNTTLLLMLLTVSGGIIIYGYTMGYITPEKMGAISTDECFGNSESSVDAGDGRITAYIRNMGKTTIQFDKIYVESEQYQYDEEESGFPAHGEFSVKVDTNYQQTIEEGEIAKIVIQDIYDGSLGQAFEKGKTYEIKIVAADSTQISFMVKIE
jgi:hypothetical protein